MLENNGTCQTLCVKKGVSGEDAKFINDRIREDYALNWLIDGLPAAEMKLDTRNGDLFFDMGFNLGTASEALSRIRYTVSRITGAEMCLLSFRE